MERTGNAVPSDDKEFPFLTHTERFKIMGLDVGPDRHHARCRWREINLEPRNFDKLLAARGRVWLWQFHAILTKIYTLKVAPQGTVPGNCIWTFW